MSAHIDTLWVILSAALVFTMQPGFMCLESGLTRSKNSINVAIKNLADFCFSVCGYWALGYGLMFGAGWAGLVGTDNFLFSLDGSGESVAFFLFQAMFCGTATTIFSGAVAERMRFSSYVLIAGLVAVFVYPVYGHWAWAGLDTGTLTGLLGKEGFVDFAGSTVVHSVGGWIALAALLVIGPRSGRFPKDGPPREINASNIPLSVLGAFLLWVGWFGFNGGSTLVMDASVPRIVAKTTLAAGFGAITCLIIGWKMSGLPKIQYLINGSLGGLVAITANCHAVTATSAMIIGCVAGAVCLLCENLLLRFKIDDAVGAVPVHLACGIWGTLAVALFGMPDALGTGLSFSGQLLIQVEGIFAAFVLSFVIPYLVMKNIDRIFPMRVTEEDEEKGLNVSEHGARTDLIDLFEVMQRQATTSDLTLRVPEEPFTEVGSIARMYNQVMSALEQAMAHTEAIVATSADAIVAFGRDTMEIMTLNPSAERMFGLAGGVPPQALVTDLFDDRDSDAHITTKGMVELTGKRADGSLFPVEAAVSEVELGSKSFLVGLFRDISGRKAAELKLREAESRYRGIFENAVEGIFQSTPDGHYIMVNPSLAIMYGFASPEDMLEHFQDIKKQLYVRDSRRDDFIEIMRSKGEVEHFESEIYRKDGTIIWISENAKAVRDDAGKVLRYEGRVIDITERKHAEMALHIKEAQFRQLFESSPLAIVHIDAKANIVAINQGYEELFGYAAQEVYGQKNNQFVVPRDLRTESHTIHKTIMNGRAVNKETVRINKKGQRIPVLLVGSPIVVDNVINGIYYTYQDISQQKAFEQELSHQAFHDALTGLPNRVLFTERLTRAIRRSERSKTNSYAAMLLDLDRFKWINDSLGHQAGDAFLQEVSRRMNECIRAVDTLARLGGDEFGILLEDFAQPREVITVARRIMASLREPYMLEGLEVSSSASVGIVLKTKQYRSPDAVVRDADIAMYRAKEQGKDCLRVFNKTMHNQVTEEMQLETELRKGLKSKEFILYYQPILSLEDNHLKGFEALVRWEHPDRGIVGPDEFIPLAEETGMIIQLGKWVLQEACHQLSSWRQEESTMENVYMSVNISGKQFMQPDLVSFVTDTLAESGVPPQNLRLEITESAVMKDARASQMVLERLKDLGVLLAIDDFGTGYSSLSYLQQFPIDVLKIDRSFVSGGQLTENSQEIVRTIVALGRSLNLEVVAEGVEKDEHAQQLRDAQCGNGQGFLFSKPVDAKEAQGMIRQLIQEK